ncbi:MAG: HesB/IscA family protein [Terriglobia bacterium]
MIELTASAVERARVLLAQHQVPASGGLRVGVQGGGCSGMTYLIRMEREPRANDKVFEFGGVKVFVDPKSLIYLSGMVLDYKVELLQQRFEFQNPNASKSCGCGESFSV